MKDDPAKTADFLLKEYEETSGNLATFASRSNEMLSRFYLYTVGLIVVLGFLHKDLAGQTPLLLLAACLVPVVGITTTNTTVFALLNLRRREIWVYNRMNHLRGIFLASRMTDPEVKRYAESPYGTTADVQMPPSKTSRNEYVYYAHLCSVMNGVWTTVLLAELLTAVVTRAHLRWLLPFVLLGSVSAGFVAGGVFWKRIPTTLSRLLNT